ncbi:hypothetical protein Tco_1520514, partial [Tanacetum coccineum]
MLSFDAARYIIKVSPALGAVSIGKAWTNFFIFLNALLASFVQCILFLPLQLFSILKKGRDLSAPFYKKRLRAASFPLRLCISLMLGVVLTR